MPDPTMIARFSAAARISKAVLGSLHPPAVALLAVALRSDSPARVEAALREAAAGLKEILRCPPDPMAAAILAVDALVAASIARRDDLPVADAIQPAAAEPPAPPPPATDPAPQPESPAAADPIEEDPIDAAEAEAAPKSGRRAGRRPRPE